MSSERKNESSEALYGLPALPYPYDALEPHIDQETMVIHHSKHHQAYVDGANEALWELQKARDEDDFSSVRRWQRDLSFNLSGHINHSIFWENMSPDGGGIPNGALMGQIKKDFGSFDAFRAHFTAAARAVQGSGWAILGWDNLGGILIVHTAENHENRTIRASIPLLLLDVWEHAYYLRYRNERARYVKAWWNLVNWVDVTKKYRRARQEV